MGDNLAHSFHPPNREQNRKFFCLDILLTQELRKRFSTPFRIRQKTDGQKFIFPRLFFLFARPACPFYGLAVTKLNSTRGLSIDKRILFLIFLSLNFAMSFLNFLYILTLRNSFNKIPFSLSSLSSIDFQFLRVLLSISLTYHPII